MLSISAFIAISALVSAASAAGPAIVNLGTAANYAILAERGISTEPTSAITGDIGVTPQGASYLTGFSLDQAAGQNWSTSSQVNGKVYAADYTSPIPSILGTALGDSNTAYTDAMGRPNPDHYNLLGGNIGGLRLYPGLYKWSTDVYMNNIVRLSGAADDVFIFQISGVLTVASSVQVVLLGGVRPENVFWAIAGGGAFGTTSKMAGIVSSQTKVFMDTGSQLTGRIFAQSAVTLYQSIVTEPSNGQGTTS